MALFKNFAIGIDTYCDAHRLIVKHNLWAYVFVTGIINLLLFAFVFFLGYITGNYIVHRVFDLLGISGEATGFFSFLIGSLHFIVKMLVYFLFFILYISTYKYLVIALISPLMAVLSKKTDELTTGRTFTNSFPQFVKDLGRGFALVLRNVLCEFGFMIVFFFIGFIPIIGLISPIIMLIISMYYFGFFMIDYTGERYRLSIKQSVKFMRNNKGFAIANGLIFYLILMIPLLGLLVAPSYAVVAATIGVEKVKEKEILEKKVSSNRQSADKP
jgi:CysZ protein